MKKYIAFGVILVISIGINLFFLFGKGIVVNISNTNHQEQYQYQQQWQGQLLINQFMVQGDKIEWKADKVSPLTIQEKLNSLHPISAMYCKIIFLNESVNDIAIIYPDIFTKTKEVEVKK